MPHLVFTLNRHDHPSGKNTGVQLTLPDGQEIRIASLDRGVTISIEAPLSVQILRTDDPEKLSPEAAASRQLPRPKNQARNRTEKGNS